MKFPLLAVRPVPAEKRRQQLYTVSGANCISHACLQHRRFFADNGAVYQDTAMPDAKSHQFMMAIAALAQQSRAVFRPARAKLVVSRVKSRVKGGGMDIDKRNC